MKTPLALPGLLAVCLLLGLRGALPARALADEEPEEAAAPERPFARAPDPATVEGPDAELFAKGLELQAKKKFISARRAFWKLLDEHPDSPFAAEAEDRSGANAFLGIWPMGEIGPSERRIDVALMGDGYLIEKQDTYDKHCEGQLKVLLGEPLYEAYRPYFNFWQFSLSSKDKGVDEVAPPIDPELEERLARKRKKRRGPKQYETALDCKAAGPQGQVMADPRRVWHYLQYLEVHDSLAIVFAQMGQLGMGGMGIATTGPRGVVVHEFGHAFVGLLDEYANNPGPPMGAIAAPNSTTDPTNPPWQHFLDAKYPGVDVLEGGATFQKGAWRPAGSCAMNSGGGFYCPVCREAAVLRIYTYVSPIDEVWPKEPEVVLEGDPDAWPTFRVLPMAPGTHDLEVQFRLAPAAVVTEPTAEPPAYDPEADLEGLDPLEKRLRRRLGAGGRPRTALPVALGLRVGATRRGMGTAHDAPPKGELLKARTRREKDLGRVTDAILPALAPGRYTLTAVVWDPAQPKGEKRPWVLKDERGLLEDRCAWTIEVR
jgi:hypothetical protein